MRSALSGMLAAMAMIAALFFLRFGRRTGDRFFDLFAVAFVLLAANSFLLAIADDPNAEGQILAYLLRLGAFVVIGLAIFLKNRE
jgi:hypothetical protein